MKQFRDVNEVRRERARQRREAARARGKFIRRFPWQVAGTFTFDRQEVFPVSHEQAKERASLWLGLASRLWRRPFAWAFIVERSKSGHYQVHALLGDAGNPDWTILEKVWRMSFGNADIRPVSDARGIARYITKVTTDGDVVFAGWASMMFVGLASDIVPRYLM